MVAFKLGGAPNGARFDRRGRLIITDRDRQLLSLNTVSGETQTLRSKHGYEALRGLNDSVIDSAGGIYFTEPYGFSAVKPDGRVFYMPPDDSAGKPRDLVGVGNTFAFPNGVALSPDEELLYVNDYATSRIIALPLLSPGLLNPGAVPYVFATLVGGNGPDGIAIDVAGNVYVAHQRGGEVVVFNRQGFAYGAIRLPAEAGIGTTNLAFWEGALYILESFKNEVWRVRTKIPGVAQANQR